MKINYNILKSCALFKGIKENDFSTALKCFNVIEKSFKKEETIFFEGEDAKSIAIVLEGEVFIIKNDYNGNRNILTSISSSELIGESFALSDTNKLPVSAIAATSTKVLIIDALKLITVCENGCDFHNIIIKNLLNIVSSKNILLNQKIEFLTKKTVKEKIMAYLTVCSDNQKFIKFTIPFNRQDMADYLGVERSSMSTELNKLKKNKIINFNKNEFIILG